jgi:hypothetical protein
MKNKLTIVAAICATLGQLSMQAAQVDIGITLGSVTGANGNILQDAKVELGVFSAYTDAAGAGYFSGKNYTTLRSSFTLLNNLDSSLVTDALGNYYGAFDTATTASGTRLFAWIFDTNDAATATSWAIVSGGGSGPNATIYNPVWLAVAPAAVENNIIEAATIYTQIFASTPGASIVLNSTIDPEGADISLVPEPSTGALMMIGAAGLVALRRLRKV